MEGRKWKVGESIASAEIFWEMPNIYGGGESGDCINIAWTCTADV